MKIERLLESGVVELLGESDGLPWRRTLAPGDDLSGLPDSLRTEIEAHWTPRVVADWREANPSPEESPRRRTVPKSVVISRLTDEQLDAALTAMTPRQKERWRSPDSPTVYADDPEVVGLITAIGADPAVVLADA